jgi:hypothetical protein
LDERRLEVTGGCVNRTFFGNKMNTSLSSHFVSMLVSDMVQYATPPELGLYV